MSFFLERLRKAWRERPFRATEEWQRKQIEWSAWIALAFVVLFYSSDYLQVKGIAEQCGPYLSVVQAVKSCEAVNGSVRLDFCVPARRVPFMDGERANLSELLQPEKLRAERVREWT